MGLGRLELPTRGLGKQVAIWTRSENSELYYMGQPLTREFELNRLYPFRIVLNQELLQNHCTVFLDGGSSPELPWDLLRSNDLWFRRPTPECYVDVSSCLVLHDTSKLSASTVGSLRNYASTPTDFPTQILTAYRSSVAALRTRSVSKCLSGH